MTTIAIFPSRNESATPTYYATDGALHSRGQTAGQALDALTAQRNADALGTLVVIQQFHPDRFFPAVQRQRLEALMAQWRAARDAGRTLPPEVQAELESLIEAEVRVSGNRAATQQGPAVV